MVIKKIYDIPMITRSQRKQKEVMATSGNSTENKDNMDEETQKLSIPSFKGIDGNVSIENWMKLFEKLTTDNKDKRNTIIIKFLDEGPLNFFIQRDLYNKQWEDIKMQFLNYFSRKKEVNMEQFLNVNLNQCADIEEYYRKKTDAASHLNVEEDFLIQILINGLPHHLKTLNLTKEFANTTEWLDFNKPLYYHLQKQDQQPLTVKDGRVQTTPKVPPVFPNSNARSPPWYDERRQYGFRRPPPTYDAYYQPVPRRMPNWNGFPPRNTAPWNGFEPRNYNIRPRPPIPQYRQWNVQDQPNFAPRRPEYDQYNPPRMNNNKI